MLADPVLQVWYLSLQPHPLGGVLRPLNTNKWQVTAETLTSECLDLQSDTRLWWRSPTKGTLNCAPYMNNTWLQTPFKILKAHLTVDSNGLQTVQRPYEMHPKLSISSVNKKKLLRRPKSTISCRSLMNHCKGPFKGTLNCGWLVKQVYVKMYRYRTSVIRSAYEN